MNTTTNISETPQRPMIYNLIRTMVRSIYDLQEIRIQMGNRICGNFRSRIGIAPGEKEADAEDEKKKLLELLRAEYRLLTDAVVEKIKDNPDEAEEEATTGGKIPTKKNFKPLDGERLITTYTELTLVHQYEQMFAQEKAQVRLLDKSLEEVPIYVNWLRDVPGVGPAMAGIIASEIDIAKAMYPSSLHMYAGLDVIVYGKYKDGNGNEKIVRAEEVDAFYEMNDYNYDIPMLIDGLYPVTFIEEGRSKKQQSLVKRQYLDKDGNTKFRDSITHNPFLKTKLIGVLGSSFLRAGSINVDGKRMGAGKREKMARDLGFAEKIKDAGERDMAVRDFLTGKGHMVEVDASTYGLVYYDYKRRLSQMEEHKEKTKGHIHAMATRRAVKIFLNDLYKVWRALENLPVAPPYEEAKLGIVHNSGINIPTHIPQKRMLVLKQREAAAAAAAA